MSNKEEELLKRLLLHSDEIARNVNDFSGHLHTLADLVGGVVHINKRENLELSFVDNASIEGFTGDIDYLNTDPAFLLDYVCDDYTKNVAFPQIFDYVGKGDYTQNFSCFQNIRRSWGADHQLHFSTMKYNPDIDRFFCMEFNVDHLDSNVNALQKLTQINEFKLKRMDAFNSLTKREVQILGWISDGFTNNEIGDKLFISPNTVRTHRNRIYAKLNIRHLRDVIRFADAFNLGEQNMY